MFVIRAIAVSTAFMIAGTAGVQAQSGPGYGPGYGMMPGWRGAPNTAPGWNGAPSPHWGMMQGWGGGSGWGMRPGMMQQGWGGHPGAGAIVDDNQDGAITSSEAAAHADTVFDAMDADEDGAMTLEEYMTVRMGPQQGFNTSWQDRMQAHKKARFDPMDSDGNGTVTKAEFISAAERHFKAADKDGDGSASPWDFRRNDWN